MPSDKAQESFTWGPLQLSVLYRGFLEPALFERAFPPLPQVTCDSCPEVKKGRLAASSKCCDVLPRFPNFLFGALLEKEDKPEKLSVWSRREPLSAGGTDEEHEARLAARQQKSPQPCPFFGKAGCKAYTLRPAPCIDYHCNYPNPLVRGLYACLSSTLMMIEREASLYLAQQLGIDLTKMAQGMLKQGGEPLLWQKYLGKEREFYRECSQRALSFSSDQLQELETQRSSRIMNRPGYSDYAELHQKDSAELSSQEQQLFMKGAVPEHLNPLGYMHQQRVLRNYLDKVESYQGSWGLSKLMTIFSGS